MTSRVRAAGSWLPVVLAAAILLCAYVFRAGILAPVLLDGLETVLTLQGGRPVELSARRVSGTWLSDLVFEDLEITYGEADDPVAMLSASALAFEYDVSRLLTADILAAFTRIRGVDLAVRLERLPSRRGESVALTERLATVLSRRLPTPVLSLDGSLVLPHEASSVLGFSVSGRLEEGMTLRVDADGESLTMVVERAPGRLSVRTDATATTAELALSGHLEARRGGTPYLAAAGRIESGRSFVDLEIDERAARASVLASAELLEEARARWSDFSDEPAPFPAELSAGDAVAAGRLTLSGQRAESLFELLLSSPSSVMHEARVRVSAEARNWSYDGTPVSTARATAEWDPEQQRLTAGTIHVDASPAAVFTAEGAELDFAEAFPLVALADATARVEDLAAVLGAAGLRAPARLPPIAVSASLLEKRLALEVSTEAEGGRATAALPRVQLSLEEAALDFALSLPAETIDGIGRTTLSDLGLARAIPEQLAAGDLSMRGDARFSGEPSDTLYSILISDPGGLLEGMTVSVDLEASGWRFRDSPRIDASLVASWDPGPGRVLVESARVEALPLARGAVEGAELEVERAFPVVALRRATVAVSDTRALLDYWGSAYAGSDPDGGMPSYAVSAEATDRRVSVELREPDREAGPDSPATASVEGSGDLLEGVVESGEFRLNGVPLAEDSTLDASGTFSGAYLTADGEPTLDAGLALEQLRIVQGDDDSREARLENVRAELSVQGSPAVPAFDLSFDASGLRVGRAVFDIDGRVSQDERSVLIHQLRADGRNGSSLRADGRVPVLLGPRGVAVRNLRSSSFSFLARAPRLHRLLPPGLHPLVSNGAAELEGRLDEESGDLRVRAVVEAGRDERAPTDSPLQGYPEITSTVRIVEREGNRIDTHLSVAVDGSRVLEQVGEIRVPGLSRAQPQLSAPRVTVSSRLELGLPLSLAPSIVPAVIFGEGRLDATLVSEGPLDALVNEGSIRVSDGGVRLAGPYPGLTALNARVTLERDGAVSGELSGELGRSPFLASGRYRGAVDEEPELQAELQGDNVLLVSEPDLRVRGDVDLSAAGSISDMTVSGRVRITEGRYTRDVPLLRFDSPPTVNEDAVQLPGASGALARATTLDIDIRGDRSLSIVNNVYQGSFSVDAQLAGTLAVPVVTGRVFSDAGMVRLPVTDLQLTHVTVTFPPEDPFSPQLQAQGSAAIRNHDVFVRAFGTVPNIEVDIASSPPLPREQAILLLTTGQANVAGLDSARRSVVTAGRVVGRRLSRLLFGPESGTSESALGRVDIEVGQRLSEEGNPVIEVDFALSSGETWFLQFERDEYDHYNLSLQWRFSFR